MRQVVAAFALVFAFAIVATAWGHYQDHQANMRTERAIQGLERAGDAVNECRTFGGC